MGGKIVVELFTDKSEFSGAQKIGFWIDNCLSVVYALLYNPNVSTDFNQTWKGKKQKQKTIHRVVIKDPNITSTRKWWFMNKL